jgi:hypothetical protein
MMNSINLDASDTLDTLDASPLSDDATHWLVVKRKSSSEYASATMVLVDTPIPELPMGYPADVYELVVRTSLEGLTLETPPKTAREILLQMRSLFGTQPLPLQYAFKHVVAEVQAAAEGENIPLMRYILERLDFTSSQVITPTQGELFRTAFLSCFNAD